MTKPSLDQLIKTTCAIFQTKQEHLTQKEWHSITLWYKQRKLSPISPRSVSEVKQVICYLACEYGMTSDKTTYKQLWQSLGYANWSHIKPNYKTIATRLDVDKALIEKVNMIKNLCSNSSFLELLPSA